MNRSVTTALIALPLAVAMSLPSSVDLARAKCQLRTASQSGESDWLTVVDGAVVDTQVFDTEVLDIEVVEIVCRPKALRFFGASGALGVVSAWTTPGPLMAMKSALAVVITEQEAYFADNNTYAHDPTKLPTRELPRRVAITLTATDVGWTATARHDQLHYLCSVFGGFVTPRQADTREGEPWCRALPR